MMGQEVHPLKLRRGDVVWVPDGDYYCVLVKTVTPDTWHRWEVIGPEGRGIVDFDPAKEHLRFKQDYALLALGEIFLEAQERFRQECCRAAGRTVLTC